MALPIAPTPVLKGKEAADFLAKVERDLKNPVGYVPTPRLAKAREIIKRNASKTKERA